MKKRVRILASLLMISGSLTFTSKSYAESYADRWGNAESENTLKRHADIKDIVSGSCAGSIGLAATGIFMGTLKNISKKEAIGSLIAASRAYKIGDVAFVGLRKIDLNKIISGKGLTSGKGIVEGLTVGALVTGAVCISLASISIASASEITENPSLAMQNDEKFRLLVESVGIDPALELVGRIADGESQETVMNSLASLLEQNSSTEKDSFLDSGYEEELGAQ